MRKLKELFNYYERQWLEKVPAEHLSVQGRHVKADSGLESVNSRSNSMCPKMHPSFYDSLGEKNSVQHIQCFLVLYLTGLSLNTFILFLSLDIIKVFNEEEFEEYNKIIYDRRKDSSSTPLPEHYNKSNKKLVDADIEGAIARSERDRNNIDFLIDVYQTYHDVLEVLKAHEDLDDYPDNI